MLRTKKRYCYNHEPLESIYAYKQECNDPV